ncbi:hypothetical protein FIA58_021110 [Flavobacterium jejuense]|uniref:Lipoprotein n=1 Tax=Flavobacterium jejuense TaxID=1544455 RepID=A0ABX0J2H0_9FLAO|nr:hypothetical protein [Flavobacterium jejuense]NHN28179.1 hypothetical protein [Flavobacterium jejuense]
MKRIIEIKLILLVLGSIILSCKSKDNLKISSKINALIVKDTLAYKALTNGYKFKIYNDGVGRDFSQPISNDSIIILKDNFTKDIHLSEINNGKSILIDSNEICKLTYKHDQEKIVMRSFLKISYIPNIDELKLEIKNWVPQYIEGGYKCVEIPNE